MKKVKVKTQQAPKIDRSVKRLFEKQEYDVLLETLPEEPSKPSTLILYGDGEYLLRKNSIGSFFAQISTHETPTLEDGPEPFFELSLPLIPETVLAAQTAFYRAIMAKYKNSEAYTLILWDKEEEEYVLICPEQEVSGATVKYNLDLSLYPSSRYIQVVSCHSHNTMEAFFSGTDDADEQADMLYMVMGKLNQPIPSYKIRANLKGQQVCLLNLSDIFTIDSIDELAPSWTGSRSDLFPEKWIDRVKPLRYERHSFTSLRLKHFKRNAGQRRIFDHYRQVHGGHPFSDPPSVFRSQLDIFGGEDDLSSFSPFDNRIYDAGVNLITSIRSGENHPEDCVYDLITELCEAGYMDPIIGSYESYIEDQEDEKELQTFNEGFYVSGPSFFSEAEDVQKLLSSQYNDMKDEEE